MSEVPGFVPSEEFENAEVEGHVQELGQEAERVSGELRQKLEGYDQFAAEIKAERERLYADYDQIREESFELAKDATFEEKRTPEYQERWDQNRQRYEENMSKRDELNQREKEYSTELSRLLDLNRELQEQNRTATNG